MDVHPCGFKKASPCSHPRPEVLSRPWLGLGRVGSLTWGNSISKGLGGREQWLGKVRALGWGPRAGKRQADPLPPPTGFDLLLRSALGSGKALTLFMPWVLYQFSLAAYKSPQIEWFNTREM